VVDRVDPTELGALPLLEGSSPAELATLAGLLRQGHGRPGEVLGRQGDKGGRFWLVVDGQVAVTVTTARGERRLAEAGPGSLLGELALLRDRPRTATITSSGTCRFLYGGRDALERLLAIDSVRARVRRLASTRLAEDVSPVPVRLSDGGEIVLRPLLAADREALDEALHALSQQTRRRRFFTAAAPTGALLDHLVDLDYVDHFAWTALDAGTGEGLAVGRYIRLADRPAAEMAFTTADRAQGRGLGTFLLGALGVAAVEAGVAELEAFVMEDNRQMRAVLAKAGAVSRYDEPGLLHLSVLPTRAASLLDGTIRSAIATSVRDIVTAASLALP
jgi:CRP-like cAMP-binding protein